MNDWVLQCAMTANADYIVTGDRALLGLAESATRRSLSPTDFVSGQGGQRLLAVRETLLLT